MNRHNIVVGAGAGLVVGDCTSIGPTERAFAAEDVSIVASHRGVRLFLRNKRPAHLGTARSERTVLFVHALTYPGHTAFDLPLDGRSWMDELALRGFDTWCVGHPRLRWVHTAERDGRAAPGQPAGARCVDRHA